MSKMRNYSKVYLDIGQRLDFRTLSMSEMKEQDRELGIDFRGHIFYIPRDAKMAGL